MIRWAIQQKTKAFEKGENTSLLLDEFIFQNFRNVLGGRVYAFISGGAPILSEVFHFLRATVTPLFIQGYGLTETYSTGTVSWVGKQDPSSVGFAFVMTQFKLRKVNGMEYDPHANPPSGEVLLRGPSMFQGYYKNEELTKEVLDEDGWLATGDIGQLNSVGDLTIVDRVKMLIKLSQGEYISLTNLTDKYGETKNTSGVFVFADCYHDYPVAVVIPDEKSITNWKNQGIPNFKESQVAIQEVLNNLNEVHTRFKMTGIEKIRKVILDDEEFTIADGTLTPSMKPKFGSLKLKYENTLLALYDE